MASPGLESSLRFGSATVPAKAERAHISAVRAVSHRAVFVESLIAGVVLLGAILALSPRDAGINRAGPHFIWIAVLVLAARYGTKGLCVALPLAAAMLAATAAVLGQMHALGRRLESSADLVALVAAVLVAWVASAHENRRGDIARELDAAKIGSRAERKAAHEMQGALVALRERADRMNLSLSFLRDVAQRLERKGPEEAATAALTLAMTCLGARAGIVELAVRNAPGAGGSAPSFVSAVGPWNGDGTAPILTSDRVVAAALEARMTVTAGDVEGAGPDDADMAAPILDSRGEPCGILALRGLPYRAAGAMALRDLAVTSGWLAEVLASPRHGDLRPS